MNQAQPAPGADLDAARAHACLWGAIALLTLWRLSVITHSGITLYIDEAYYWSWSRELAWGYFSKPPVVAALIAASTALLGDGLIGVKAASLVLYPATAWMLYALGAQLYSRRIGLIAALALLTLPITAALGLFISTDAPLLLCWTAALLCLQRALHGTQSLRAWLLLGLVCGLGLLSKYTMAAFALSAAVLLLGTAPGRLALKGPGPWLCALLALALLSPNLWWNYANDFPTFRHTAEITHLAAGEASQGNLLEFIGAQVGSIGPLLFIGLVGGLAGLRRAWREPSDRLLLAGTLPLLLLVIAQAAESEANANWAGPAYTGGTLLAVAWLSRSAARRKLLWAALALNLCIMALVYHWPSVLQLSGKPLTAKLDPLKRMKGWDRLAEAVAPFAAAYPEAYIVSDERVLLAHMDYGLRALPVRIASWNPDRTRHDQYQITHSLPNTAGVDIIYLSKSDASGVATRFTSAELIAKLRIGTHPDHAITQDVWLMRGFKGY